MIKRYNVPPSTWETRMDVLTYFRRMAWLNGMLGVVSRYDRELSIFDLAYTALD